MIDDPRTTRHAPLRSASEKAMDSESRRPDTGRTPDASPGTVELLRSLVEDLRLWFSSETDLIKTELGEKSREAGRSVGSIAGGALVAFAGAILILIALGGASATGLAALGIDPLLASFLGFFLVGLIVIAIGAAVAKSALDKLSASHLKPQRSVNSLRNASEVGRSNIHQPNATTS